MVHTAELWGAVVASLPWAQAVPMVMRLTLALWQLCWGRWTFHPIHLKMERKKKWHFLTRDAKCVISDGGEGIGSLAGNPTQVTAAGAPKPSPCATRDAPRKFVIF